MAKIVDGVEYLTATEAVKEIGGSRQSFYQNVKPYLRPYHFESRKAPWYNKNDVIAIATGKPNRKASIAITGMFTNWTEHARSLGLNAETQLTEVTIGYLPDDIVSAFRISANELFVKRGRMTTVDGTPICSWDSYYPLKYVEDILPQMRQGTASDIVEHIKEKHGVAIGKVLDRYSTRITTLAELNKFRLLADEPVLILQRAARTRDEQTLVLFSDMVLLGSWFVIERTEELDLAS